MQRCRLIQTAVVLHAEGIICDSRCDLLHQSFILNYGLVALIRTFLSFDGRVISIVVIDWRGRIVLRVGAYMALDWKSDELTCKT